MNLCPKSRVCKKRNSVCVGVSGTLLTKRKAGKQHNYLRIHSPGDATWSSPSRQSFWATITWSAHADPYCTS